MRGLKDRISKFGITYRIAALFMALVIIPYLALAGIVILFFRNYTVESLADGAIDSMASVGTQLAETIRKREEDTMSFYYSGCVELLAKGAEASAEEKKQIESEISSYRFSNSGIHAVSMTSWDGSTFVAGNYPEMLGVMESHKEEISQAGGRCLWYCTSKLHGKADEYKFVLARSLNSIDRKNSGILYVVLDFDMAADIFEQMKSVNTVRYLVDSEGNVIYSSDKQMLGETLDISAVDPRKRGSYQVKTDGRIMVSRQVMEVGWYCISTIEMQEIRKSMGQLAVPFVIISGVYILFLLLMLYMMRRYIFSPLGILKRNMDHYAQGELQTVHMEQIGIGEFRSISEHFNNMTIRIDTLMKDYKEEVDEKNRQKMIALTSSLTPHFIYNALNTIKWVAVLNHQENIQSLVESLIYIFMNAAKMDDEDYTVEDELRLIEHYAVIQKARFMNFDLVVEKDENCMKCRIRKLLVQPIVENAIVHGLGRGKIPNTEIHIKVWTDDDLHIEVTDRGVGFDVEEWRKNPGKRRDHTNIGIGNIEKIIELEYGQPYQMQIESTPGRGTRVSYFLPVIRKEEGHDSDDNRR